LVLQTATENLNQWYQSGDQAFIIVSSCMVLIMVPGIAFLYSGLSRRKSALSLIWVVMMSFSVIVFQWYFWGYSLAFSSTATNGFIGNLNHFGLMNTLAVPSPGSPLVPELLYSFFQVRLCRVPVNPLLFCLARVGRAVNCG
jgi:ammonium transporter, Amt family